VEKEKTVVRWWIGKHQRPKRGKKQIPVIYDEAQGKKSRFLRIAQFNHEAEERNIEEHKEESFFETLYRWVSPKIKSHTIPIF